MGLFSSKKFIRFKYTCIADIGDKVVLKNGAIMEVTDVIAKFCCSNKQVRYDIELNGFMIIRDISDKIDKVERAVSNGGRQ